MALMMCGDPGVSAFPEGDNILSWIGTITGSKDTVYEGMIFKLSLIFTNEYPFKPPKLKFLSSCFHPNVDTSGNICLDILQDKWSSAYDVRTVLLSIQSLLGEPNNESPLNTQAANLWTNQPEFRKMVVKLCSPPIEALKLNWILIVIDLDRCLYFVFITIIYLLFLGKKLFFFSCLFYFKSKHEISPRVISIYHWGNGRRLE